MCSQCFRFHQNQFTFSGVIAERVSTVFCPLEYFHNSPEAMLRFWRIIYYSKQQTYTKYNKTFNLQNILLLLFTYLF